MSLSVSLCYSESLPGGGDVDDDDNQYWCYADTLGGGGYIE